MMFDIPHRTRRAVAAVLTVVVVGSTAAVAIPAASAPAAVPLQAAQAHDTLPARGRPRPRRFSVADGPGQLSAGLVTRPLHPGGFLLSAGPQMHYCTLIWQREAGQHVARME